MLKKNNIVHTILMTPKNIDINVGSPQPLGLSFLEERANFSLFSSTAKKITLGLFRDDHPIIELPMNRTGDIWHLSINNLPEGLEYAYKRDQTDLWLMDPYAKIIGEKRALAKKPTSFDWQNDTPPNIPKKDQILYEMHVRGFTQDPTSKVAHPGTFLGVIEKIPYLIKLGVNAVELMPIFNFKKGIANGRLNYWGYSPINFFAPANWYAHKDAVTEFKTMVRELHKNGIEVILDVVYNHTGEGGEQNSFRVLDKNVYYMINEEGYDLNYSGCGNTLNVNHPIVQNLILDSLAYWIEEMHVDGFRFDLASIFSRDQKGNPLDHPPILDLMKMDPVISQVKLIAEAWDAAGLYQIGFFPNFGPWSEWNGQYRDAARKFIKGDSDQREAFSNALLGSPSIYKETPTSSINFITAHDGFCLFDLVTYQEKHNKANGENNQDGCNQNDNWNCGVEGPTNDPKINALREKQLRNFLVALFISQGIPMLLMGDEAGHTRKGNNNPYTQDNELNWQLWDQIDPKIFKFVSQLINFRKKNKNLTQNIFLPKEDIEWRSGYASENHFIAFVLKKHSPHLLIAFNSHHEESSHELPSGKWSLVVDSEEDWLFHENGAEISKIKLPPYSCMICKETS